MVTICTASLTFNNSTLCPHSVFMCFVWISEQTAIISLYNINWLVFITQTMCVYCPVRTLCTYNVTCADTPNTAITTLSKCQYVLYADWSTEKRTFEEVSWTADWLPLKVTQSSRGRHARHGTWSQTLPRKLVSFYGVLFPRNGWPLQTMSPTTAPTLAVVHIKRFCDTPSARLYLSLTNYILGQVLWPNKGQNCTEQNIWAQIRKR